MNFPQRPFYFVRHGQTDWNLAGRMQGVSDIPLNQTGIDQAFAVAGKISDTAVTRLIVSPLLRALKTAAIIAEARQLPMQVDSQLMERSFGSYEGQYTAEMRLKHNLPEDESITKILPPDAEHWPQTLSRSHATIAKWLLSCPDDTLLFVGHAAFFRALYESLGGPTTEAKNGKVYHFIPHAQGWQFVAL